MLTKITDFVIKFAYSVKMQPHESTPISPGSPEPVAPTSTEDSDNEQDSSSSGEQSSTYSQLLKQEPESHLEKPGSNNHLLQGARMPGSKSWILQLLLDLSLAIPAVAFLAFAYMIIKHDGYDFDQDPIPMLRNAARFGPTIFPIAFAAVAANLLKATAAWKLERGVTVLNLEYLLSSRTVFSTVTTPFVLRTVNVVTPFLFGFWALSPLGGQATLRAMDFTSSTAVEPWPFQYLEYMTLFPHTGPTGNTGPDHLPAAQGAFYAALSSPKSIKTSPQDAFGNIKIPLIEAVRRGNQADANGWYDIASDESVVYSSISGLPSTPMGSFSPGLIYSFSLKTSYMYSNCSVSYREQKEERIPYVKNGYKELQSMTQWTNGQTLAVGYRRGSYAEPKSDTSMLVFTSFTARGVTNATCNMTTSYVEAEISCQGSTCRSLRIRTVETPQNITLRTVLDGLRAPWYKEPFVFATYSFLGGFVNASNTPWNYQWADMPYSTPIEYYFTYPDSPYIAPVIRTSGSYSFKGHDIYPISDVDFSEKLTQLLNTFWIVNIAPRGVSGNFTYGGPDSIADVVIRQNMTGTRTPDRIVTRTNVPWLVVLVVASLSMLSAGVAAAVLGALRRGPDVLDRATIFLRSNPNAELPQTSSMEDGIEQARRVKHVRVCVGDVKSEDDVGEVALGTVGNLIPLSWQRDGRVYS